MKAQISRLTHRPAERFSGVYLQQGRMVTDADWNEAAEVSKELARSGFADTVGSGVPEDGGILEFAGDGTAALRWGIAFVDGIRAAVVPADGDLERPFAVSDQADLLAARKGDANLEDGLGVYLDVWERVVVSAEDDALRDPAFGGADTAFRTQVMAQVKQCPVEDGSPVCAEPGAMPARGSGRLAAELRDNLDDPDPCDPCADELPATADVGNFLFRLEIHDVDGDTVTLKWSEENGAEEYALDPSPPAALDDGRHLFEFVTLRTEQNLGVFLHRPADWNVSPGVLAPTLSPRPDPPAGEQWQRVRRWDGSCTLERTATSWKATGGTEKGQSLVSGGGDRITVSGRKVTLPLSRLELTLDLSGDARVVRGDTWFVVVRGDAGEAAGGVDPRVQVLTEEPSGVTHHYLYLGTWDGGRLDVGGDDARRRRAFPPLTDIGAEDVGYAGRCESGLLGPEHTTVQKALDALCDIDASHVAYDPGCDLLAPTGNVGEALDLLCEEVGKRVQECWPRLALFGRGVVCGVVPRASVRRDDREAFLDAVVDFVRHQPDTPAADRLERAERMERMERRHDAVEEAPPASEERERLVERVAGAARALDFAGIEEAVAEIQPELRTGRLDRLIELVGTVDELPARAVDTIVVSFRTDAGTVIDGKGCIHRVGTLQLNEAIPAYRVELVVSDAGLKKIRRSLVRLAREQPSIGGTSLVASTFERDVAERVDDILAALTGGINSERKLERVVAELGWRSTKLRDEVIEIAKEGMERRRRPVETVGWLYLAFDAAARPRLEFRQQPPTPWVHAPSAMVPSRGTKILADEGVMRRVVEEAVAHTVEGTGGEAPDAAGLVDEFSDEEGRVELGRLARTVRHRTGTVEERGRIPSEEEESTTVLTSLLGARAAETLAREGGGVGATFTLGGGRLTDAVAVATAFEEAAAELARRAGEQPVPEERGRPPRIVVPVNPGVVVVGDEGFDHREALAAAWDAYRDVECPVENDGSVCLAKVGVYGSLVVVAPDDREQLFATPAQVNAVHMQRMPDVFDQIFAQAKAGAG